MFRSTTLARIVAIAAVILCLIASFASRASAAIIGVDVSGTTPTNWTSAPSAGLYSNLVDETGAATAVDVTLDYLGASQVNQALNAATVPTHSNALDNLGSYNDGALEVNFSDLVPNAAYRFWILATADVSGGKPAYFVDVTGAPSVSFSFEITGDLLINGVTGSSAQTLASYALETTSSAAGKIDFFFVNVSDLFVRPLSGVAIERVEVPEPASYALLAIGGAMVFWRKRVA